MKSLGSLKLPFYGRAFERDMPDGWRPVGLHPGESGGMPSVVLLYEYDPQAPEMEEQFVFIYEGDSVSKRVGDSDALCLGTFSHARFQGALYLVQPLEDKTAHLNGRDCKLPDNFTPPSSSRG